MPALTAALWAAVAAWIAYLLYAVGWLPGATALQAKDYAWAAGVVTFIAGSLTLVLDGGTTGGGNRARRQRRRQQGHEQRRDGQQDDGDHQRRMGPDQLLPDALWRFSSAG